MATDMYEKKKEEFFKALKTDNPETIQNLTVGQHSNDYWKRVRMNRLTASNFGRICKLRPTTSTANTVKHLLYQDFQGSVATRYGLENEINAVLEFEKVSKVKTEECGIFVHKAIPFLAASPDRVIIDENGCVEIKCPYRARDMTVLEATQKGVMKFLSINEGNLQLKHNDNYMYQIQGQLNVADKDFCYFVVWTKKDMWYQKIFKNESMWQKMTQKLKSFYMKALLPEILDSRKLRDRELREVFLGQD
ncbi:YqaJ-like viral recombinase domain [Popillia japonica]|uniref:YqaJ-like viral recombinase domain n=1 Tax=Popillia japonica TaxID=7064 RepID=A0AAW1MYR5_POPJA